MLINNAGVVQGKPLLDLSSADIQQLVYAPRLSMLFTHK